MKQLLNVLENLRQISGNAQIEYLDSVKTPLLKEVLEYTYDTHKKYKIDEGKFNKAMIWTHDYTGKCDFNIDAWNQYTKLLDRLAEMKSAKDTAVESIKDFIYQFDLNASTFLKMVLFKDLRIGMNIKKFQKVWPDFCCNYPYMGCRGFNMKNLQAIEYPAFAQTKMDGSFCNIIVDIKNRTVEYVSRQSKSQPIKGSLDNILLNQLVVKDHFTTKFVLTGEVLVWNNETNKPYERKISNGVLRRENKTPEELNSIHFVCWDFLPFDKFIEKRWDVPYNQRFAWLEEALTGLDKIHIVSTWKVNSLEEAMDKFNEQYALGEEGVVIKEFTQIWQDGKPKGQVKIKAEKDCDLQMIEFLEGKGQYADMCGSIRCVSCDSKLEVMVKPRTPEDAEKLWYNQELYLNKILTVKYNEKITSDTKEKPSLYLPVFVEIRDDKNVADKFEDIQ